MANAPLRGGICVHVGVQAQISHLMHGEGGRGGRLEGSKVEY
jgi:hypothetical protein